MTQDEAEKLKVWLTGTFWSITDVTAEGGCDTCGYGAERGISLDGIKEAIDRFVKETQQ